MLQIVLVPPDDSEPHAGMRPMQGAMNSLSNGVRLLDRPAVHPLVNFCANENDIVLTTELPDQTRQDIGLAVKETVLSVRGTYSELETGDDIIRYLRECMDVTRENGVPTDTLPKTAEVQEKVKHVSTKTA